ncbi:hypothetical protein V6N13_059178 [Hibiscus sabdariffa]
MPPNLIVVRIDGRNFCSKIVSAIKRFAWSYCLVSKFFKEEIEIFSFISQGLHSENRSWKRDQKNNEEEDSSIPASREPAEPNKTKFESKADEESTVELSRKNKVDAGEKEEPKEDTTSTCEELAVAKSNLNVENGSASNIVEDVVGLHEKEVILENDTLGTSRIVTSKGKQLDGTITDDTLTEDNHLDGTIMDGIVIQVNHLDARSEFV